MANLGGTDFDRLLEDARRSLETIRSSSPTPDPGRGGEPTRGTGEAGAGRITATVAAGGRLESIRMDPRALRMGSEELCEQIVLAVNAAFDDLRIKIGTEAAGESAGDPAELTDQLRDLQDQSMRQMAVYTQAINDALGQLGRRG
jgi:hypothetical protein